jgi:diguanylate cyclase (GGDEF)-like protein
MATRIAFLIALGLLVLAPSRTHAEDTEAIAARLEELGKLALNDPKQAAGALLDYQSVVERDGDGASRARWQFAYAATQDGLGNLAQAEQGYRRAIALGEEAGDTKTILEGAYTLALLLNQTERFPEVAEVASKYLLIARQAGDLAQLSMLEQQLGRMFAAIGDEENALSQMKDAVKAAEASGSEEAISLAEYHLAIASAAAQQYDLAAQLFEKSLAYDRAHDNAAQNVTMDLVRLGQAIAGKGDLAGGRRQLEEAVSLASSTGFVYEQAFALTALSQVLLDAGKYADAAVTSERALTLLASDPMGSTRADAVTAHARALAATGDHRTAAAFFQDAMQVYEAKGKLDAVASARSGLAEAQAAMGNVQAAFESSRRAVAETKSAADLARQRSRDALRIAYAVEREAAENERLKSEIAAQTAKLEEQIRRARWQRLALSSLMVLLTVSLLVYFWQRRMRRELYCLARTDSLTNVANRRAILEYGAQQLRECRQRKGSMSIVALDVDNFKAINDRFGHDAGDQVLRKVSSMFAANIRKADMIGRLGGEEFLIVLPGYDAEEAAAVADRLREMLARTVMSEIAPGVRVTSSFGVASLVDAGNDFSELLRHADRRLYRAKDVGRNKVVYLPMHERTQVFVRKVP